MIGIKAVIARKRVASAPGGSVFVNDTFTDTDTTTLQSHTGETGATWTIHPSYSLSAEIVTNRLANGNTGSSVGYYASGIPTGTDYDVEVDFIEIADSGGADYGPGFTAYMSTTANSFYQVKYDEGNAEWQLNLWTAGTPSALDTPFAQALTTGQAYKVRGEFRDGTQDIYIDEVLRLSATDTSLTGGTVGYRTYNGSLVEGVHLDNFTATNK